MPGRRPTPPTTPPKIVLPPEAERVRFTITTPGIDAQILDARDEGQYGKTNDPSGVEVKKSEEKITLILRAAGYEDLRVEIIPNEDKKFEKTLVKAAATAPPATPTNTPPTKKTTPKTTKQGGGSGGDTKPDKPPQSDDGGGDEEIKNPFKRGGG